jgi:signal transduction histidine kinase
LAADKQQQGGSLELLLGEIDDLGELASDVLGDPRRDRAADEATLTGVAAAVQAAARTVAVARGATVRVQAATQAEVQASPTMLSQAIENLIDNAAAHGGPDGLEVDVAPTRRPARWRWWSPRRPAARPGVAPRDGGGTLVGLRVPPRPAAEPDPLDNAVNT